MTEKKLLPVLPIEWRTLDESDPNRQRMKTVGRSEAYHEVEVPTLKEIAKFGNQQAKTCGMCKHFRRPDEDKGAKDRPAISGFVARAIHEFQWQTRFLVDKPERLGRCDQRTDTAVGPNSGACDAFKERPFR